MERAILCGSPIQLGGLAPATKKSFNGKPKATVFFGVATQSPSACR
jgi:hypothetical protein